MISSWLELVRPPVPLAGYRWDPILTALVELPPMGKQRARHTLMVGNGRGARRARGSDRVSDTRSRTYTPDATASWTDSATIILRARASAAGFRARDRYTPLSVDLVAAFPPPARPLHPALHVVKPDRDNVDKLVLDAMKRAGLLVDDDQVAAGGLVKVYARPPARPGVLIVMHALVPGDAPPPTARLPLEL